MIPLLLSAQTIKMKQQEDYILNTDIFQHHKYIHKFAFPLVIYLGSKDLFLGICVCIFLTLSSILQHFLFFGWLVRSNILFKQSETFWKLSPSIWPTNKSARTHQTVQWFFAKLSPWQKSFKLRNSLDPINWLGFFVSEEFSSLLKASIQTIPWEKSSKKWSCQNFSPGHDDF